MPMLLPASVVSGGNSSPTLVLSVSPAGRQLVAAGNINLSVVGPTDLATATWNGSANTITLTAVKAGTTTVTVATQNVAAGQGFTLTMTFIVTQVGSSFFIAVGSGEFQEI